MINNELYSYISIQKKQIKDFEEKEFYKLIDDKSKELDIEKEIIRFLLTFYKADTIENAYKILNSYFIQKIKNNNSIILEPCIENQNRKINYNCNDNTVTVGYSTASALLMDENNPTLKNKMFYATYETPINNNTPNDSSNDDILEGQTSMEDYLEGDVNDFDYEEADKEDKPINSVADGNTALFNKMLRGNK